MNDRQQNRITEGEMMAYSSRIKPKSGWSAVFNDTAVYVLEVGIIEFGCVDDVGIQEDLYFGK